MSRYVNASNGAVFKTRTPTALRFRYLFLAIIIFGGNILFLVMNSSTRINRRHTQDYKDINQHPFTSSEINYTIQTDGCSIPLMEPFSSSAKKYHEYPSFIKKCPDSEQRLLETDKVKIWINKKYMSKYIVTKSEKEMKCCYQAFYRSKSTEDITHLSVITDEVIYDDCKYFIDTIEVKDEFLKVGCFIESKKNYEQYFLFVTKKKLSDLAEKPIVDPEYNVLILGIDSVSRLNFIRTMPKTMEFLKTKGAVEMLGYNKVGDNSLPNLIPMLVGVRHTELRRLCIPRNRHTHYSCPYIWEWFKKAGYQTALGEDSSRLGEFGLIKMEIVNNPTDYYIHTFMDQAEKNVGTYVIQDANICMHDIPFYKVLLNYVEDLTTTLKNFKLFGFFWETSMSHEDLNSPILMDDDYEQLLRGLENKQYLNNTILVVVSDHGMRFGKSRQNKQGRLEERLPFLYILTPPQFRTKYYHAYESLKINSQRLTTPFDLHATLSDLVYPSLSITNTTILSRLKTHYSKDKSISLFLPVPYNRTCKAADIDDHWCTCYKYVAAPKTNIIVLEAAAVLVKSLNEMLLDYLKCARLTLSKIIDANFIEVGLTEENEDGWDEFIVVVATDPGGAIFEATLRKEKSRWKLLGTISRLNLHGVQSHCVTDSLMKLYCYCI